MTGTQVGDGILTPAVGGRAQPLCRCAEVSTELGSLHTPVQPEEGTQAHGEPGTLVFRAALFMIAKHWSPRPPQKAKVTRTVVHPAEDTTQNERSRATDHNKDKPPGMMMSEKSHCDTVEDSPIEHSGNANSQGGAQTCGSRD